MADESLSAPIKSPDQVVGQSVKTEVYSFKDSSQVAKIEHGQYARTFENSTKAIEEAKARTEIQNHLAELIKQQGGRSSAVPTQNSFVYASGENVMIGSSQEHIKDAVTLKSIHGDLSRLSPQALKDLRAILATNLELWTKERKFFDIVGSDTSGYSLFKLLIQSLNPLENASNIIIDSQGNPKLVDTELVAGPHLNNQRFKKVGFQIAAWGLTRALKKIDAQLAHAPTALKLQST